MADQLLQAIAPDVSPGVLGFLDVESLLSLEIVSSSARDILREAIETRCKCACFSTYLYPTMATYTTMAAAPHTWKALYLRFSRLREMEWTACKTDGTSSTLRSLKTDNQEYVADLESEFLLRSGGHYWFSVLQTPLAGVVLSSEALPKELHELEEPDKEKVLTFFRAPLSIHVGKWEKLRADGPSPCPRRHHSMTCLSRVSCPLRVLQSTATETSDQVVAVRRVLFFGGQAEGVPFEAFNDLHVLLIDGRAKNESSAKTLARWVRPDASGKPPPRRCGHEATLLSNNLVLISGGSDGTTPYPSLDVFLLHIDEDHAFGRFRWSTPRTDSLPLGRAMHSVHRIDEDNVIIFGGRQIRQSNGLLDVYGLTLQAANDPCDDASCHAQWTNHNIAGSVPGPRRGHSTIAVGDKLLLIGGQDVATEELVCDVRVLDVPRFEWRFPHVHAETPPCPRRGFKTQYFGTSLVISSGFVLNTATNKIDQQLPDGDIHVLTFR